ncbi:hypothetical protein L1987_24070 [Smallanthus sonchifolius]|uniref:Uncharacterized protein n=1 Tax=Smallanthus sonchifolius TaxID=185202 RepID=A0ACB9IK08_9ASTR|nr:hypothetical protein L1987_24070 [Smallanthus sonchifolius]
MLIRTPNSLFGRAIVLYAAQSGSNKRVKLNWANARVGEGKMNTPMLILMEFLKNGRFVYQTSFFGETL